jgi:argininosuccinate synthase
VPNNLFSILYDTKEIIRDQKHKLDAKSHALVMAKKKVVLAYSGGLDTSVCIRYLQKFHDAAVTTLTVDCGQGEDFHEIENRALAVGAAKHIHVDSKEEFANEYVSRSIRANALYQGKYPLATALARPLIASKLVEAASTEDAKLVAHGCTGKGNDQVRFDITIKSINPELNIIAPIRDMNLSRDEELRFATKENIPISLEAKKYSVDVNLWGRAIEGGELENASVEPPENVFHFVKQHSSGTRYVEIEFKSGIPISLDGSMLKLQELIVEMNKIAGSHGIGIVDLIENRIVGIKSREIYEAPAAISLIECHKDLENLVLTDHEINFKRIIEEKWSWLVYSGLWLEPLRRDLDKFIDTVQSRVDGKVKLRLQNGSCRVIGRTSNNAIYDPKVATYSSKSVFDQSLAKGFIELWGRQSVVSNQISSSVKPA